MKYETARPDLLAGLSIAGLMLPEAVAYAGIAGLPPERAVIAGMAGLAAYLLLGQSRFAVVAPTSSSAAILAATLAAVPASAEMRGILVSWTVLFTGLIFLAAAALRLGGLTGFISRPVLRGFSFGLAVTIIIHQLPQVFGLEAGGANLAASLLDLIRQLPSTNAASLSIGAASLALLLLLKRFPRIPGPLIVLAAGAALASLVDLQAHDVRSVGDIALKPGFAYFALLPPEVLSGLAQYSLPMVLILFAESWGTVRSLALKHGENPRPNRELGAFALANLASAVFGGMPVGAGFSAGNAMEAAGAKTRFAGLAAGVGLVLLVAFGHERLALLPQAVPAAVVIAALTHALDPRPFMRLWKLRKDNLLAISATLAVLVFGVLDGLLLAVVLSLIVLLGRISHPVIARLARLPETRDYVDVARHPDARLPFDLAIYRPAAPLFYANADTVLTAVTGLAGEEPGLRRVVLSLEETFELDTTTLDQLLEFDHAMQSQGCAINYARVHDHVRDMLKRAGEVDFLKRCFYSVDDAVRGLEPAAA